MPLLIRLICCGRLACLNGRAYSSFYRATDQLAGAVPEQQPADRCANCAVIWCAVSLPQTSEDVTCYCVIMAAGSIPASIRQLTSLRKLSLGHNQLTGAWLCSCLPVRSVSAHSVEYLPDVCGRLHSFVHRPVQQLEMAVFEQ